MNRCITTESCLPVSGLFAPESLALAGAFILEQFKAMDMINDEKINRDKWLHLRLSDQEQRAMLKRYAGTTHLNLSGYARAVLMGKPVVSAVRNQDLQQVLAELTAMRKDLSGVANNFNQAVHKLHTLDHVSQIKGWVLGYDLELRKLMKEIEKIRYYLDRTAEKWLQS